MPPVDTQHSARALSLPRLWFQPKPRTSRQRIQKWKTATLATDIVVLATAAVVFDFAAPFDASSLGSRLAFSALVLLLFAVRGLYALRLRVHFLDDLPHIFSATAAAAMLVIAMRVVLGSEPAAVQVVHYWLLVAGSLIVGRAGTNLAQARAWRRGETERPTLILGAGKVGHLTAKRLLERPELGLRPVGFLDKEPLELGDVSVRLPVLGASWDLDRIISEYGVEHVIVTFSTAPYHVIVGLTRRCWERGVSVSLVPRLFEVDGRRVSVEHLGGLPFIGIDVTDPKGWQFAVKYAIDRVVAAVALLFALPLFGAVGLAIRVSMGKPVFYRQKRVGRDGHAFEMLKFRTMRGKPEESGEADVEWALRELSESGAVAAGQSPNGGHGEKRPAVDDRRTPLGRLLRKFSLDELPQLLNVLRGDMSLIGPRPERLSYVERFEHRVHRYGDRHRVKSGITGWAQVNGLRGKTSLADRVEWDNHYVGHWSPWLDFKIVLMTVAAVLRGETGDQ